MIITSPYRIHINSIDLNGTFQRCCGGLGFAVEAPALQLQISRATQNKIHTSHGTEAEKFVDLLRRVEGFPYPLCITEISAVRPHVGLGSFTQFKLAVLRAVRCFKRQPLTPADIPPELCIGSTSGVGLGTFFHGGLIVDGGYRVIPDRKKTVNGEAAGRPAPILARYEMPRNWGVILAIPREIQSISGEREAEFFDAITPVPRDETREIAYRILMGVLPAVCEADFGTFITSVKAVCELGSKPHEIRLNSSCLAVVEAMETQLGFGGVSSLGPTCYSFFNWSWQIGEVVAEFSRCFPDYNWVRTGFCNRSHRISNARGM